MQKTENDEREEHSLQDAAEEEGYAAFPGGIPKRWLNPAIYFFLIILGAYALWVGSGEILEGRQAGIHLRKTMGVIWAHLSDFAFNLTIAMIGGSKILERIMYYLQAKKLAKQHEQRADAAEQLAAEYKQRFEQMRQQFEQAQQQFEQAQQHTEQTQRLLEQERQRADAAEKRADAAEAKNGGDSR